MLGVLIFDTLPGLVIGIIVSLMLLLYRSSKPHVAELGRVDTDGVAQFADRDRHPENEPSTAFRCCASSPGCSSPTPTPCATAIKAHAAEPGTRGVVLDAEAIAFVDITAVRMLDELADDLDRDGQQLVIAHDLGQVGDLLSANAETNLQVVPTIDEAIAAITPISKDASA